MWFWKTVVVGLFYCCIKTGVTRYRTKALFPTANRFRREVTTGASPTFHTSYTDVYLLFEILQAGIHFEASGGFSVKDAELASLRKTRNLEVIYENMIPRKITDIFKLVADISNHVHHLHQDDFERTLLTLVYISHQMVNSTTVHQKDAWAESFVSLYKAIKYDLTGTN